MRNGLIGFFVVALIVAASFSNAWSSSEGTGAGDTKKFEWERLGDGTTGHTFRAPVPGGWLVRTSGADTSMTFIGDDQHSWIADPKVEPLPMIRVGSLLKLTIAKDSTQPRPSPGSQVCPCVYISLGQLVSFQPVEQGDVIGKSVVKTTGGEFRVWQTVDEISPAANW